jgi:hypothetical protein
MAMKRKLEITISGKPVDIDFFDETLACFNQDMTVKQLRESLKMLG